MCTESERDLDSESLTHTPGETIQASILPHPPPLPLFFLFWHQPSPVRLRLLQLASPPWQRYSAEK